MSKASVCLLSRKAVSLLMSLALIGCASSDALRVGSYNIRCPNDTDENNWDVRKADMTRFIERMDLDLVGMQEVTPAQLEYLKQRLPGYVFVGEFTKADRKSGESSPVAYRTERFEAERGGTFWLSETPDVPGSKSWHSACIRVCSYLVLKDRVTGKRLCFANTHTDHISAEAREKGMLLVIERMREFGKGCPIVFTGDHNCTHETPPSVAVRKVLNDARDISETKDPGPANTWNNWGNPEQMGNPQYRIDYIYVSDGTRVFDFVTYDDKRPGTDLYPSDHFPVTATVVLP